MAEGCVLATTRIEEGVGNDAGGKVFGGVGIGGGAVGWIGGECGGLKRRGRGER